MKSKTALVYIPGWPLRTSSFMPKSSLAVLAGRMAGCDKPLRILDFGVVDTVRRFSGVLSEFSVKPAEAMISNSFSSRLRRLFDNDGMGEFLRVRREWRTEIAGQIMGESPERLVYLADTRDEYREARGVALMVRRQNPHIQQCVIGAHAHKYGVLFAASEEPFSHYGNNVEDWLLLPGVFGPGEPEPAAEYDPSVYPALYSGGKFHCFTVGTGGNSVGICAEMRRIQRHVPVCAFDVAGSLPLARAMDMAAEFVARRMETAYACTLAPGGSAEGAASLLHATGCRSAAVDVPTGSQRLLEDFYGCGYGVSQARNLMRILRAQGISVTAQLVYPCPRDDRHTRAETELLLDQSLPEGVVAGYPECHPRSRWAESPELFGFNCPPAQQLRWARGDDRPELCDTGAPLPCGGMRGWTPESARAAQQSLLREVETRGTVAGLGQAEALIARVAGFEGREQAWHHRVQTALATGDFNELSALITAFNRRAAGAPRANQPEWLPLDLAAAAN